MKMNSLKTLVLVLCAVFMAPQAYANETLNGVYASLELVDDALVLRDFPICPDRETVCAVRVVTLIAKLINPLSQDIQLEIYPTLCGIALPDCQEIVNSTIPAHSTTIIEKRKVLVSKEPDFISHAWHRTDPGQTSFSAQVYIPPFTENAILDGINTVNSNVVSTQSAVQDVKSAVVNGNQGLEAHLTRQDTTLNAVNNYVKRIYTLANNTYNYAVKIFNLLMQVYNLLIQP